MSLWLRQFHRKTPSMCRRLSSVTFANVQKSQPDPIQELTKLTKADSSPDKIDLGAGVYRNEQGRYHEFETVKKAKERLERLKIGHDYNPTIGIPTFRELSAKLMFGENSSALVEKRIASIQTVAGTGANRTGAAFLKRNYSGLDNKTPIAYVGEPAWGNYKPLFENAGFYVETYTHLEKGASEPDFDSVFSTMENAPEKSIFILQACCHNPTGLDYDRTQWKKLAEIMRQRRHFAFIDAAYTGFGSGKENAIEDDLWPLRYFVDQGVDMLVCQSFSKIMGLYSERVGALHVVCGEEEIAENVLDQLRAQIRWEVSSTPAYGAQIASIILEDKELKKKWLKELKEAAGRIEENRKRLHSLLTGDLKTPGSWKHMQREKGLFSFTGLEKGQIEDLMKKHHVYLPLNGRINVAGLSAANMERAAEAIDNVVRNH